jgi:hypothetical protein
MASVVDQNVNRDATLTQPPLESDDCRDIGKINLLHDDLDSVLLAEGFRESFQPVKSPGDQNQRMIPLGILAGELLAKATGCAGYEDPSFGCRYCVHIHSADLTFRFQEH